MSITIELTPEREARLLELFGSPTAARVWLESIVVAATDHPAVKPDLVQKPPSARRALGQQRGAVTYIAPDFDDPLPDSFWMGEE
jgi:hypothetical protein